MIREPFVIESESRALEAEDYKFSGLKVRVMHSPGSALYYFPDERLLLLGDTEAFHRIQRHDLANSNVSSRIESLTRLKTLCLPDDTEVFFWHGEHMSYREMLRGAGPLHENFDPQRQD